METHKEPLSYQEKKSIVTLVSSTLIFAGYSWYMYAAYGDTPAVGKPAFWATFILVLIPVSIAAKIVISIVFSILFRVTTNEKEPGFMDELDKLIGLKATRNAHYVFVGGVLSGMGAIASGLPVSVFFLCIVVSGFLSEVVDAATQLYLYRKGL